MEHDKLATRLSLIIYKLNQGERLTIESLANEFGVSKRTIERDIARFSYFDIKKEGKEFFLDELAVGKLNFDDIKNFAIFSGIKSLFPSLTNQFLKDILNDKINGNLNKKTITNSASTYYLTSATTNKKSNNEKTTRTFESKELYERGTNKYDILKSLNKEAIVW